MVGLPRWTHIALRVRDIDASIAFYEEHTPLELLDKRRDENGFGAWLGHSDQPDSPFILVLAQFMPGHDPFEGTEPAALGPFAHIGIELAERADVDARATAARDGGFLMLGPEDLPDPIGYICFVRDPDGNTIEFSHGQKVFEFARENMRAAADG